MKIHLLDSDSHLTANQRSGIRRMIQAGILHGRIGRTCYNLKYDAPSDTWKADIRWKQSDDWGRMRTHGGVYHVRVTHDRRPEGLFAGGAA